MAGGKNRNNKEIFELRVFSFHHLCFELNISNLTLSELRSRMAIEDETNMITSLMNLLQVQYRKSS